MKTMTAIGSFVHPFYVTNSLRLYTCPGDRKHPATAGYADSNFKAFDLQGMLSDDPDCTRYCWLLDDDHLVIDVDTHTALDNGWEALQRLCEDIGVDLIAACGAIVDTPTGGAHLYFRKPAEMMLRSLITANPTRYGGLDTCSHVLRNNSLVIAAGSTHPAVDGLYTFRQESPVLVDAPPELLDLIKTERVVIPDGATGGVPKTIGDRFQMSWAGVEKLAAMLYERGYLFHIADDGQQFYEYQRAGKTTASRVSGYLGKLNSNGRYQWTGFSLSCPYVANCETITILEGLRRVLFGGVEAADAEPGRGWPAVMAKLQEWGFGASAEDYFGAETHEALVAVGSDLAPTQGEFWNYELIEIPGEKGKPKKIPSGFTMPQLVAPWVAGGWPKNCQGKLFIESHGPDGRAIQRLDKPEDLFAWIGFQKRVNWLSGGDRVSKSEFYSGLAGAVKRVESVEEMPHFPPVSSVHYLNLPTIGDENDLWEFVDHFSPLTLLDRELICASVVTPFWGALGGTRPLFLVTSPGAQGSGKSTLVNAVSRLTGNGVARKHQISNRDQFRDLPRHLANASPTSPASKRIIVVDNWKGATLGGSDIEAIITEQRITAWALFQGTVELENRFCWFVTGNYISFSDDLADRTVEIALAKPPAYSAEWQRELDNWDIGKVVAGIGAFFQRQVRLGQKTNRFSSWCEQILGRMPHGDDLVDLIADRAGELKASKDEIIEIDGWLRAYVSTEPVPTNDDGEFIIRSPNFAEWLREHKKPCPYKGGWNAVNVGRLVTPMCHLSVTLRSQRTKTDRVFLFRV